MATTIKLKNGSGAPLASDLVQGEVALDLTNKRLYTEDSGGTVIEIGTSPSTIDINAGTVDGISSLSTANGTDVSFAGVSATKFFWDASAEALGIGTSSPNRPVHLGGAGSRNYFKAETTALTSGDEAGLDIKTGTAQWLVHSKGDAKDLIFYDAASVAERLRIDSSGNVGIGTSSPSDKLTLDSGQMRLSDNYGIRWGDASAGIYGNGSSDFLQFVTGSTERARIDSSGNLLVGQTSASLSTTGWYIRKGIESGIVADGSSCLVMNRLTSDGDIQKFAKDGTVVGSIGNLATSMYISGSTSQAGLLFNGTSYEPTTNGSTRVDNSITIGSGSYRYKDLYLSGGVYLGGTGAANHLDDYEEGTFTPTVHDAVTGGNTGSAGAAVGSYVKVGNMVTVWFSLTNIVTTGLTSGNAIHFGGLPFTISSTCLGQLTGNFAAVGTEVHQALLGNVGYTRTNIYVHYDGGNEGSIAVTNFTSGSGDFIGTLTYQTA